MKVRIVIVAIAALVLYAMASAPATAQARPDLRVQGTLGEPRIVTAPDGSVVRLFPFAGTASFGPSKSFAGDGIGSQHEVQLDRQSLGFEAAFESDFAVFCARTDPRNGSCAVRGDGILAVGSWNIEIFEPRAGGQLVFTSKFFFCFGWRCRERDER